MARKPRKPLTAADRKQARYWLKRLGLDPKTLGLEQLLSPNRAGAPKHDDAALLVSLELFVRSTARTRGISRKAALRTLVDGWWVLDNTLGPNAKAALARLSRKLREGGFDRRNAKALVPREWLKRGIDPERFTTFPVTKDLRAIDPEKFTSRKLAKLERVAPGRYIVVTDD